VDLPEPTQPVISTRPAFLFEKLLMISGMLSESNSGIESAIILNTRPYHDFCLKPFTRNLPSPSA